MPTATETNGAARTEDVRAATIASSSRPRLVKPVAITLDKERTMVMDFAAMERFEDATGVSAWSREAWDGRPRYVARLVWAALLHEEPDLAFDVVTPHVTMANLSYLTERLSELWGETMPDADETASGSEAAGASDPNPRRRAG